MYGMDQFENELKELRIVLSDVQKQQFEEYYKLLVEWNEVMNLTAITDYKDVMKKHFFDSLTVVCAYPEILTEAVSVIDIGTGYNSDVFRQEMGASQGEEKELRLIFAGKISEKKGVKSLIRSLDYLKDSGLIISLELAGGAGDEGEYQEIRELAEKCPFAVTFAGKITQQELAKKMNQSDVFVLPSFYEGLPLVIIEALACGTYVICTDLPGIRNWIDQNLPDNGVVFVEPPKRVNEDEPVEEELPVFEKKLAGAIEGIAKYPGSKPEKEHLEQISWDGLCVHLMKIFEQQSVYRKTL